MSPQLEANCLLLSANVSYENAARDLQKLTGVYVDHSTQQRLVHRQEFAELEVGETVTELNHNDEKFSIGIISRKICTKLVALKNGYEMLKLFSGAVKLMQPLQLLPIGTIL